MLPRRFSDREEVSIGRRYLAGASMAALAHAFGAPKATIAHALRRVGCPSRRQGAPRLYACNEHFFDHIDTEAKAYWLGFLAADGSVQDGRARLVLALQSADEAHVRRFRAALCASQLIRSGHQGRSRRIVLDSKTLVTALRPFGIVPRKTATLRWPALPRPLLRHFLRGYFDGDGCWYGHGPRIGFDLCGNWHFLHYCQRYLIRACGLSKTKLYPRPGMHHLAYSGRRQAACIARHLYSGATVYLPRKHSVVRPLLPLA